MGRRGPKPEPRSLRLLKGNPSKKPIRPGHPMPEAKAKCPNTLQGQARKEWKRIAPTLEQLGLLTAIDQEVLAAYCLAVESFSWAVRTLRREGRLHVAGNGRRTVHPAFTVQRAAMAQIRAFGSELGLSPGARAALGIEFDPNIDRNERFFGPHPVSGPRPSTKRRDLE